MSKALELTIHLPDEAATVALAEDAAAALTVGDLITLSGGLGTGKTCFARALLRAVADDPSLEVPSPTFTLAQAYSGGRLPVTHFDFYRLSSPDELDEIGFDDALAGGAAIVEWPERAFGRMQKERLSIDLAMAGEGRRATISGSGPIHARFLRSRAVRGFLDRVDWRPATRRHLQGDASTRRYERVWSDHRQAVLMDWPRATAKTEPQAIYRAENVDAFLATGQALRRAGFSAPEIYAADSEAGLLLMEDFGTAGVIADGVPIEERYFAALDVLAAIHGQDRSDRLPLPDGSIYALPLLGFEALAAEANMLLDWYLPHISVTPATQAQRDSFDSVWRPLLEKVAASQKSWALLDFHSPNLFWLPQRGGLKRIGLIDFQDMHMAPIAYDVASLAQDARVTVPAELEQALVAHYVAARAGDPEFDRDAFVETYAILAVQRATRILGVFARLAAHGKPGYLRHIPRLREYLSRTLGQPVLSELALCYETHRLL